MTYFSRDEYSASSEEYFPDQRSDFPLFSQPAEVDQWCQSIQLSSGFPLTPPDTASDCAPSDCADMTFQPCSIPEEEWTATFSDNSTWMPVQDCDWQNQRSPIMKQEAYSLDTAWPNPPHGSVEVELSPSLSHESQTSRTLSSHANMEVSHFPQGLDLSFIGNGESVWDPLYPVTAQGLNTTHQDLLTGIIGPSPFSSVNGLPTHLAYQALSGPSVAASSPQLSMHSSQSQVDSSRRRTFSDASAVQQRPLLPRNPPQYAGPESHTVSRQCRALKPRQISVGYADTVNSVSDASGPVQVPTGVRHGYTVPNSGSQSFDVQAMGINAVQSSVTSSMEAPYQRRATAPVPNAQDSTVLDYDSFIKYDQEDQVSSQTSSYPQARNSASGRPSTSTVMLTARPSNEIPTWTPSTNLPVSVSSNDENEGRSRSHPLYSQPPAADGMYYCPFAEETNCQHKPAKLKCAYDKFLDSHLKPFTCNKEVCGKLQFSSTACLLRHEREAHGMHGHGNRPHLCLYHGCDRSQADNGFPRKYNLNDHMKRVHGHQEQAQDRNSYPEGDSKIPRKGGGRKRKSQGAAPEEPSSQRQRQLSHDQHLPHGQWST